MTTVFQKVALLAQKGIGLDRLGKDFKRFAIMHCTYSVFQAMVSAYIVTLLMRVSDNSDIVIWYQFVDFIFHGVSVLLGVVVMRKGSVNLAVRVSILGFILLYTSLLITMAQADVFMILFAFLNGFSNALYWLAYAAYMSAFTGDDNRDAALGVMGLVNGVTALIMPAISGFAIEAIGKTYGTLTGYIAVFALSFAVAVVAILLSLRLPKQVNVSESKKTYFKEAFRTIAHDHCWKCGMACETLRGMRDGTLNFLLNFLLFDLIQSEALVGVNNLLASIGAILSYWIAGKLLHPDNRVKSMFIGSSVLLVAVGLLGISYNQVTIMIFAILNSFFATFIVNPSNGIMFLIIQKKSPGYMANEYLSIRDLFLCIGRLLSVSVLLVFPRVSYGYVLAIAVLTLSQFVVVGLSKRSTRLLREMDEREDVSPEPVG